MLLNGALADGRWGGKPEGIVVVLQGMPVQSDEAAARHCLGECGLPDDTILELTMSASGEEARAVVAGSNEHLVDMAVATAPSMVCFVAGKPTIVKLIKEDVFVVEDGTTLLMPTRPELAVREVLVHKVRGYTSAEAPVSLVCNCRPLTDSEGGAVPAKVLYKLDDLRQDQIYMNIIRLMWRILQGDTAFMQKLSGMVGDDFDIITYDVLPLSSRDGLLQWVDSAAFADVVKETQSKPDRKNSAILHYLVQTASQGADIAANKKRLEASINRFVVSTAIYTAISYLLGVKDRHMDNFKVTPQGDMFHIDYGWVSNPSHSTQPPARPSHTQPTPTLTRPTTPVAPPSLVLAQIVRHRSWRRGRCDTVSSSVT